MSAERATATIPTRVRRRSGSLASGSHFFFHSQASVSTPRIRLVLPAVPNWHEHVSKRLTAIAALGPNWDGYGAIRIPQSIRSTARRLAVAIYPFVKNVALPRVMPTANSHIQFEWHHDGKILEIEVEPDDKIHFLKWDPASQVEEEDFAFVVQEGTIKRLAEWLAE